MLNKKRDREIAALYSDDVEKYTIFRHIWRVIYPLLIWLCITYVANLLLVFVLTIFYSLRDGLDGDTLEATVTSTLKNQSLMPILVTNTLCAIVFIPIWFKMKKKLPLFENARLKIITVVLTLITFVSFSVFLSLTLSVIDINRFFPSYGAVEETLNSGSFLMQILCIGILAPIIEEVLCRGIIFNRLLEWMPKWTAVLVSAALFALLHFNLFQSSYTFIIGVAFALIYLRYRSLWIPIIAHIAFNSANIINMEIFKVTGAEISPLLLIIPAALIITASIVIMFRFTKPASLVQKSGVIYSN